MDDAFKVLQQKDIYELLEGSSDFEIVASDGNRYGMPYLTQFLIRLHILILFDECSFSVYNYIVRVNAMYILK